MEIDRNMDIFTYCYSEKLVEYVRNILWREIQDLPTKWEFNVTIRKKSIYSSYCQEKLTEYV